MTALTTENGATPTAEERPDAEARHKLMAVTGLAALSLDAMAFVAYGPDAIGLVLGTGWVSRFRSPWVSPASLPSYRQVIAAFPDGGGSYAVAERPTHPQTTVDQPRNRHPRTPPPTLTTTDTKPRDRTMVPAVIATIASITL